MFEQGTIHLPARFWVGVVATLVWSSLMMGVYYFALDNASRAATFSVFGVALLVLAIATRAPVRLKDRPVLRPLVWLLVAWFAIFTLFELWSVVTTPATLGIRRTLMAVHEAGLIILVTFTIWQFVGSIRSAR
jgi:hypothetical protein